jgi:hypothetical protein
MKEPTDLELIDHYLDRLPSDRRREISAELDRSPALRQRHDQLAALWRVLGEADIGDPQRDLWPGLLDQLRTEAASPKARGATAPTSWWMAAAASVLVAAFVGYGSAQLRLRQQPEIASTAVEESDVITQLDLAAFDNGTFAQLGETLVEAQTERSSES